MKIHLLNNNFCNIVNLSCPNVYTRDGNIILGLCLVLMTLVYMFDKVFASFFSFDMQKLAHKKMHVN